MKSTNHDDNDENDGGDFDEEQALHPRAASVEKLVDFCAEEFGKSCSNFPIYVRSKFIIVCTFCCLLFTAECVRTITALLSFWRPKEPLFSIH